MAIAEHDPGFDTLAYARTLREAGVEARQAEAHAEAARAARAGLATRADLDNLEARLNARSDNLEMRLNAKTDELEKRMLRVAIAIVMAQTALTAALTAGLTFGLLKMFGGVG